VSTQWPVVSRVLHFDTHEWILIFFGRNVTDKVDNEKPLYYATSNVLTCACALPGKTGKDKNQIFTGRRNARIESAVL